MESLIGRIKSLLIYWLKMTVIQLTGANRIRTGDLFNAIEARYQLRYSPLQNKCNY